MTDRSNARTVYSSSAGRVCPTCGWPADDCTCSPVRRSASREGGSGFARDEAVPARLTAKLRMEKKGRGGKTVTVVYGLPRNAVFLKELAQELKRVCGTGGAAAEESVELQGDLRDRVRDHLKNKGYVVKG
jgi:translation initiation factor 1